MTSHFPFPSKAANNCLRAGNQASKKWTKRANLPPLETISLTTGTSTFPYECTRKGWLMHFTSIISNGSNLFKFHRIQTILVVNVSAALDVLINERNAVQFKLSGMKLVCWNHPDGMHDTHIRVQLHHPLLAPDIYLFAAVSFNVGAPLQSVRSVTRFSIVEPFVHIRRRFFSKSFLFKLNRKQLHWINQKPFPFE